MKDSYKIYSNCRQYSVELERLLKSLGYSYDESNNNYILDDENISDVTIFMNEKLFTDKRIRGSIGKDINQNEIIYYYPYEHLKIKQLLQFWFLKPNYEKRRLIRD